MQKAQPPVPPSARGQAREVSRKRRERKRYDRHRLLEIIMRGYSYAEVAAEAGISIATLRREVDKALAERPVPPVENYVALQIARLEKALLRVGNAMERDEFSVIPAYTSLLRELDRYHGLAGFVESRKRAAQELQESAPKPLISLT